jgi:hypothetical protein
MITPAREMPRTQRTTPVVWPCRASVADFVGGGVSFIWATLERKVNAAATSRLRRMLNFDKRNEHCADAKNRGVLCRNFQGSVSAATLLTRAMPSRLSCWPATARTVSGRAAPPSCPLWAFRTMRSPSLARSKPTPVQAERPGFRSIETFAACVDRPFIWERENAGRDLIMAGTLDDRSFVRPGKILFCASAQEWLQDQANIPSFEQYG